MQSLLLTCFLFCANAVFAADAEKPKPDAAPPDKAAAAGQPVRLKFVPLKKGEPGGKGASGTALTRKGFDPTALVAMIHIGLNDSFPIHDDQGHTFFTIRMTDGNDANLVFE